MWNRKLGIGAAAVATLTLGAVVRCELRPVSWSTVVNNGDTVAGSTRVFDGYGQPAVNERGLVVFRGRRRRSEASAGET